MSSIQSKITKHVKKQENVPQNEKRKKESSQQTQTLR